MATNYRQPVQRPRYDTPQRRPGTARPPANTGQRPPGALPPTNSRAWVQATGSPRADYNAASAEFTSDVVLFPSSLRVESGALGSTNAVVFDLQNGGGTAANVNEMLLKQNDAFVAQQIFVGLGRFVTANGVASKIVHTFPNLLVFSAANEAISLPGFYNGRVNIQINDIVYGSNIDMLNFLRADTAMQALGVSTVATVGIQPYSAWERNKAFMMLTPQIIFNGLSNNFITLNFPTSINLTAVALTENSAVLMLRGLLAQNGARSRN